MVWSGQARKSSQVFQVRLGQVRSFSIGHVGHRSVQDQVGQVRSVKSGQVRSFRSGQVRSCQVGELVRSDRSGHVKQVWAGQVGQVRSGRSGQVSEAVQFRSG